jgi:hypothetical protein
LRDNRELSEEERSLEELYVKDMGGYIYDELNMEIKCLEDRRRNLKREKQLRD